MYFASAWHFGQWKKEAVLSRSIIRCRRFHAQLILAALTLFVILLAGCGLFEADENSEPAIRTEKQNYTLSQSGETLALSINMTYTNRTFKPTFLLTCNGAFSMVLEKSVDGNWVQAYGSAAPDCLGPVLTIKKNGQHHYTLNVLAFIPSSENSPKFQVDNVSGTYRLVWTVYKTLNPEGYQPASGWGPLLPLEQRVSNNFEIAQ